MRTLEKLTGLAIALAVVSAPALGGTFNVVSDFSLGSNPNGSWSYLADGSLMGSTGDPCVVESSVTGLICRQNGGSDAGGTLAFVGKNTTASDITVSPTVTLPPNYLDLNPQDIADVVIEWKAPAAGTYDVNGSFYGLVLNEQAHTIGVNADGVPLFVLANMDNQGQVDSFSGFIDLALGDTLDFIVNTGPGDTDQTGDGPRFLDTGLAVTISSAVPEPGALALLASAAIMLAFSRTRIRKRIRVQR